VPPVVVVMLCSRALWPGPAAEVLPITTLEGSLSWRVGVKVLNGPNAMSLAEPPPVLPTRVTAPVVGLMVYIEVPEPPFVAKNVPSDGRIASLSK
jgi:hypothetical protein